MAGSHNSGTLLLLLLQQRYPFPTIIMFNYLKELKDIKEQYSYKLLEEEPCCVQCTRCGEEGRRKRMRRRRKIGRRKKRNLERMPMLKCMEIIN
jgi:hypothetical protein